MSLSTHLQRTASSRSGSRGICRARRLCQPVVGSLQANARQQGTADLGDAAQRVSAALLAAFHVASTSAALILSTPQNAHAVLNSPNAQIPRTADAALRRAIPAFNLEVKRLQSSLEDIAFLLRIPQRKPWGSMANNVKETLSTVQNKKSVLLEGVPQSSLPEANIAVDRMYTSLKKLELAIAGQQPDMVSLQVAAVLKEVAALELLQAPGLAYALPRDYRQLPRLVGRATVELQIEKADGSLAFVDKANGGVKSATTIELTLDGYSAPITAGNFVQNVVQGLYNNTPLTANYSALYVQPQLPTEKPPVPLEILPAGEFDPVYRSTLDVQSGELPVLPLSIYGAVSMSHIPSSDTFMSGQEWFVYKFDRQLAGLAGLAFDEGTFGVFGYVTKGADVLQSLGEGDVIVSAKVVSGLDKLVVPGGPAPALAN